MVDSSDTPAPASAAQNGNYDALGEAKRLLRSVRAGALATLGADGSPLASLVSIATQLDGSPLLLLSRLAGHTTHLEADPRCSLLLAQSGKGDPLAHPRLSLVGEARRIEAENARAAARARFVARNPKAELYVDFPDFGFWQVSVAAVHLNGGFARAARFDGPEVLTSLEGCEALAAAERGAVEHMNADHQDALRLYGTVLARAGDGDWRASGLDPEGIDLICGDRTARVAFGRLVRGPGDLRSVLKTLADTARSR